MDLFVNLIITCGFVLYGIYAKIAYLFAVLFPNLTKYIVHQMTYIMYGITINGPESTDIKVLNPDKFYPRVVSEFGYGIANAYVNGEWSVNDFAATMVKIMKTERFGYMLHPMRHVMERLNLQSRKKAWEAASHYNSGADVFEAFLGKNLLYSSGYWRNAQNLDEAQLAKMDLVARKLHLKPGMKVLDIGCGWGTMACYLARNFNVSVVGCTISVEQMKYFQERFEGNLPIEIRLCDYRELNEKFDRIICLNMIEHVGPKNYDVFMTVANRCLTDDGIFLIECWGITDNYFPSFDVWISTYLLPNMQVPYYHQLWNATRKQWVIEDWHNMGYDFLRTAIAWKEHFIKSWPALHAKYDDTTYRTYMLFFAFMEGVFETKKHHHWHIVLRKNESAGSYVSVR